MRLLRLSVWVLFALPIIATAQTASYIAVQVEAENFNSKHPDWHRVSAGNQPNVRPDPDPSHHSGASNGAYLELLPDTRVTHSDPLQSGTNFWGSAGTGPSLSYNVNIPEAGRYLVYVKAYSTGSEDNGIHVGLNNSFPASGNRMQWCNGKNQWTWSSAQRTNSNHCGVARTIYLDIPFAGANTINFTAREDGFEFDQFILLKEDRSSLRCEPNQNDQITCNQTATNTSGTDAPAPQPAPEPVPAPAPEPAPEPEPAPQNDPIENEMSTDDAANSNGLPECASAASDADADGYGWEDNQSCQVTSAAPVASDTQHPQCTSAQSDADGDGFGWERNATCLAGVQSDNSVVPNSVVPACESAASDPDGDGWGWEDNRSCLIQ